MRRHFEANDGLVSGFHIFGLNGRLSMENGS